MKIFLLRFYFEELPKVASCGCIRIIQQKNPPSLRMRTAKCLPIFIRKENIPQVTTVLYRGLTRYCFNCKIRDKKTTNIHSVLYVRSYRISFIAIHPFLTVALLSLGLLPYSRADIHLRTTKYINGDRVFTGKFIYPLTR